MSQMRLRAEFHKSQFADEAICIIRKSSIIHKICRLIVNFTNILLHKVECCCNFAAETSKHMRVLVAPSEQGHAQ